MLWSGRLLLMALTILVLALILAAANGANDVSKVISTLFGSGVANYRRAVLWGTVWTAAGSLVAAFASQKLVATFNGASFLVSGSSTEPFVLAVASGAIGWLVIATRTGLPVSTTHSLLGGLVGAAVFDAGTGGVMWSAVMARAAMPLLLSPLLSIALMLAVLPLFGRVFQRANRYCVCIEEQSSVAMLPDGTAALRSSMTLTAGKECAGATTQVNAVDSAHWISSGATCFFRGLNDTPKIFALAAAAVVSLALPVTAMYFLVTVAMAAGALTAGFRVTRTLAKRVTPISAENGFASNLVTSVLVGLASFFALPVSTTQVSTGSILAIGLARGGKQVQWKKVGEILLAWLVTLPASAALAATTLWLLQVSFRA